MIKKDYPLVSVVVVTYNSEKTIFETLESIKNQTYKNLELIISDDCSKDNTVEICKQWLIKNNKSFINVQIVESSKNTGISGNCNRGYKVANGTWIKGIAGDDLLMEDCIENNINYVLNNNKSKIILSKTALIGESYKINKYKNLFNYGALNLNKKNLLYLLLVDNFVPASTLFIKKEIFIQLGGFDERMPLLEDWPFWIKALHNNINLSFNNEFTIYYRVSESSISLSSNPNPLYIKSINYFLNNYLPKYQWKTNKLLWVYYKVYQYRNNKRIIIRIISSLLLYINPIYHYIKIIKNKANKLNKSFL